MEETQADVVDRRYTAYGAAADYFAFEGLEALCESGAGTGKSYSLMQKANWVARQHPYSRQLFCRQTRKSMTDSILPDWRLRVLFEGHPAISSSASAAHQDEYRYPNGSVIVLGGLENIDRILSAQYDRIYIYQAEETTLESWEKLISRLRNSMTGYHQITADVNPASEFHWLNKRFEDQHEQRRRFLYRHEDNPLLYDHDRDQWTDWGVKYVTEVLGSLSGVRRERLLYHRWVAEEGVIYEEYDPAVHLITAELEHKPELGRRYLHVAGWEEPVNLLWFTAGVDWGFWPDPGVIQVWGYDDHKPLPRRFLVAEVYRTRWQLEEWAEVAEDLWREFDLRFFACDPSRPDSIAAFNTRIGKFRGRSAPHIAIKADADWESGVDLVRWGLRDPLDGRVHTYLLRDVLRHGRDEDLARAGRPVCFHQEIHSYTYLKQEDGKPNKEKPDPTCDDHGCDASRYDAKLNWRRNFAVKQPKQEWPEGTYGHLYKKMLSGKQARLPWG